MVNSFNWGQNKSFWPDQKRREISTEAKMSLFFKQTQIVLLSFTIALLILGPRQLTRPSGQVKKYKKRVNNTTSAISQAEAEECRCKRCITRAMTNPLMTLNSVSQIDKISRIVFPLAFMLLNVFYWFNYLKQSEKIDLNFESA
jgi:hypothetical protein